MIRVSWRDKVSKCFLYMVRETDEQLFHVITKIQGFFLGVKSFRLPWISQSIAIHKPPIKCTATIVNLISFWLPLSNFAIWRSTDSIYFNELFIVSAFLKAAWKAIKVVWRQAFYTSCLHQFYPSTNKLKDFFFHFPFAFLARIVFFGTKSFRPFDAFERGFLAESKENLLM